jgi:GNAT superfamily N-acetyltransferase
LSTHEERFAERRITVRARVRARAVQLSRTVAVASEVAEAEAWADNVRALGSRVGNPLGARLLRAGAATVPVVRSVGSPLVNRVIGLGIVAPALEEDVDAVVAAYGEHELGFAVSVAPHAEPAELQEWLEQRGLVPSSSFAKLWRRTAAPPTAETSLRIERIGAERARDFSRVNCAAWHLDGDFAAWFEASVGRPCWRHYLAFDDEQPVAAGALFVHDGAAWLGFAATLPRHRGRGAHAALLARRIRDAVELGCELVVTEAHPSTPARPSPSYRNIRAAGFELAYLRPNYTLTGASR